MTTQVLDLVQATSAIVEAGGDWAKVAPAIRVALYRQICDEHGMNPLVRPIDLLKDKSGKLIPYVNKSGTAQIVDRREVSIEIRKRCSEKDGEWLLLTVEARASLPSGRFNDELGVVEVGPDASANDLSNAWMKARTKAGRRAVLGLVGLGLLDESEVLDAGLTRVSLDIESGDVIDTTATVSQAKPKAIAPKSEAKCTGPAAPIAQACRDRVRALGALVDAKPGEVWAWWCNQLEIPPGPDGNPPTADQLTVSEGTRMKDALAEEIDAVKRRNGDGEEPSENAEADGLDDDLAELNRATGNLESTFPGTKTSPAKRSRAEAPS
jgi:hypothetical protein